MELIKRRDYLQDFVNADIGSVISIPISYITPSQTDDHRPSRTNGAIDACSDSGMIIIIHGNHRNYDLKRRTRFGNPKLQVRKVINHYLDF